ncbi:ATP-binding protein [Demequina mangrovi]|uniref:ATPase family associated with various cellular activities (AAA) n=1 Tax=Demequina mangrovi TaxID=1043493 RepID=A0A1H6U1W0_9MICO|nr:ATP-binding protein [Demequina mangrovi]SEI82400.1 ATPase family associated with various cellular activities (AAA) [Demequina mangrovi]
MSEAPYETLAWSGSESGDLTARAGAIALRIADVVELHCAPETGAADAVTFLREWADSAGAAGAASVLMPDSPLERLASAYGLSSDEVDVLILAGVAEEHEGLAATFRSLHPTGEPRPTAGLAALLFGGGNAERARLRSMLASGPGVRSGLIRVEGTAPFFERSLLLAEELWAALHGWEAWPGALARVESSGVPDGMDPWLDLPAVEACIETLRQDARALIAVPHPDPVVSLARCEAIAHAADLRAVAASFDEGDEAGAALLAVHARARGAVPTVVLPATDRPRSVPMARFPGAVLVSMAPGALAPPADRPLIHLDPDTLPFAAVRDAWAAAVPSPGVDIDLLAARHPLDPAVTAQLARDLALTDGDWDARTISTAVRGRAGASLPPGVRLTQPAVPWEQLVLPPPALDQLHAAVARLGAQATVLEEWSMRQRAQGNRGVRMLFTGTPGTGKTLAAAALATAIDTDLMVVDVARLVSKWLGETEKNLGAVFEAAERTRAVLLLDEADALFGTRTEISDAHDRYANLETAYLLQRVEQFDGLIVLTSNLRKNIDPAFTRRLDFVVDFPLPDVEASEALWDRLLPHDATAVRATDLDIGALARLYRIPGGWIRNAALSASFAAAARDEAITQDLLVGAVHREYQKASAPFPGEPPRRRDDHHR